MLLSKHEAVRLKLMLLSEGITFSDAFLTAFKNDSTLMPKRRMYNTSDTAALPRSTRIPQEIFISDVVVAVNFRENSPWSLDATDNGFVLVKNREPITDITIKRAPSFLKMQTSSGTPCASVANLYGGGSLAYFTPASCYYFVDGSECRFCSLATTRKEEQGFASVVSPDEAADVLQVALASDPEVLTQIMLVGGNLRNYDTGFLRHVAVTEQLNLRQEQLYGSVRLQTHIATMPPTDLQLLDRLRDLKCHITMNLEVFDAERFEEVAPGKAADFGRIKMWNALEKAARVVRGRLVHSILIAGLEPIKRTIDGIRALPEIGITPIINVFHNDRGSHYEHFPRPGFEELLEIAYALEEVYEKHDLIPYWKGCGRNSIDFEAQQKWFSLGH